jgi:hypothetical protein
MKMKKIGSTFVSAMLIEALVCFVVCAAGMMVS